MGNESPNEARTVPARPMLCAARAARVPSQNPHPQRGDFAADRVPLQAECFSDNERAEYINKRVLALSMF